MMEDVQKRTALDVAAACGKESVLALFEDENSRFIPVLHQNSG